MSEGNSLSAAGKKASLEMRRLSRAVGSNDWTKMDMWLQELKHGMGFNCMKLYMIENHDIPDEFAELQNKYVVYHDDIGDYATNEPTMDGTAGAILMMAFWGDTSKH